MAAPIKFLRCCRFKSFYNLQQTRTHIGVPKSLYPTVDSHRRPHKLDHDEYFGDAPVATKSWAKIQEGRIRFLRDSECVADTKAVFGWHHSVCLNSEYLSSFQEE